MEKENKEKGVPNEKKIRGWIKENLEQFMLKYQEDMVKEEEAQDKELQEQKQKEIKRWGVGFFLAWVASIVASIIYITGGIFMLDFPTVWSAFGVLNISIFLGVVTVICVVVILE